MKTIAIKMGDVFEVPLPEKMVGYVRAIGKHEYGTMFQIYKGMFRKPLEELEFDKANLPVEAVAFINAYAVKKAWKLRFRGKSGIEIMPKSFYGSPDRWWYSKDGDKIVKISPKEMTYDQMIAAGYVHNALWLPKHIEELLVSGKPLIWTCWP